MEEFAGDLSLRKDRLQGNRTARESVRITEMVASSIYLESPSRASRPPIMCFPTLSHRFMAGNRYHSIAVTDCLEPEVAERFRPVDVNLNPPAFTYNHGISTTQPHS